MVSSLMASEYIVKKSVLLSKASTQNNILESEDYSMIF